MKKQLFLAMVALALAGSASALTLQEAVERANRDNPTLQAKRAEVRAVKQGIETAKAGFLPEADAVASISRQKQDFSGATADTTTRPRSTGVEVTQNLFNGLRDVAGVRSARTQFAATEAGLQSTEQTVFLDVVTAYTDVLRDEEVVRLNRFQVDVLKRQLEATKARFELGELTLTDVRQAEARLAAAEADTIEAEGNVAASRARFTQLTGLEPVHMAWPEMVSSLPTNIDDVRSEVLSNHPLVVQALNTLAVQKYAVETARGTFMPTVDARASYTKNDNVSQGTTASDYDDTTVSLNLNVPLFRGGSNVSRYRAAIATREQADETYQDIRRQVERELVDALNAYRTVQAQLVSLDATVKASGLALNGVEREAEVGSRTVLDVLDARREYLEAQVDLTRAKRNELVNSFRLLAALGRLTADRLPGTFRTAAAAPAVTADAEVKRDAAAEAAAAPVAPVAPATPAPETPAPAAVAAPAETDRPKLNIPPLEVVRPVPEVAAPTPEPLDLKRPTPKKIQFD